MKGVEEADIWAWKVEEAGTWGLRVEFFLGSRNGGCGYLWKIGGGVETFGHKEQRVLWCSGCRWRAFRCIGWRLRVFGRKWFMGRHLGVGGERYLSARDGGVGRLGVRSGGRVLLGVEG